MGDSQQRVCAKLDKYSVATLDQDGNCVHATGSLRKVLDPAAGITEQIDVA